MSDTSSLSTPTARRKELSRTQLAVRWLLLAAVLVAIFLLGERALREAPTAGGPGAPGGGEAANGQAPAMPPAAVFLDTVQLEHTREKYRVTGSLRAVARAEVAAREAGPVGEIFVNEGDEVKKGDPLVTMDDRRLNAELAEAEATMTAAEALVIQRDAESKRAVEDLDMKRGLFDKRAVSRREVLDAEREKAVSAAQQKAAQDQLTVAKSRLSLLRVREEDLRITAPFDGRIVERMIEPGEWLQPGTTVVSLVSKGDIEAWLDVPQRFASDIASETGELVILAEGGDAPAPAKSIRTVTDVDVRSRLFPVVVTVDDHGGKLVPGMSVHADVPVGDKEDLLVVPADAVNSSRMGEFVFVVRNPPLAEGSDDAGAALPIGDRVAVKVRFRRDGKVFLEKNNQIQSGDRVVTEGNERLRPGQSLQISQKPAPESGTEPKPKLEPSAS